MDQAVRDQILAEVNELKEVCRRARIIKIDRDGPWVQVLGQVRGEGRRKVHVRKIWGAWPSDEWLISWVADGRPAKGRVTETAPGERDIRVRV